VNPRDPWADPATETQQGAPYAGPPATAPSAGWPPAHGAPPYGAPPYGPPPYGAPQGGWPPPWPGWGWPPPPARSARPGQVIGAAVLAFVQAALVLFGSLYVYTLASVAGLAASDVGVGTGFPASRAEDLAREGQVLALVQLGSVVLLVVGGILALTRATRAAWVTLLVAFGVQVALALYWAVRSTGLVDALPGSGGIGGILFGLTLFFAAVPLTGLGLVAVGPGRRWFTRPPG
jgi:hypothetical protein